jgi:hypothetical protein
MAGVAESTSAKLIYWQGMYMKMKLVKKLSKNMKHKEFPNVWEV